MGSPLRCQRAAHGQRSGQLPCFSVWDFAMKIRLPTTSIYGDSGQLSRQPSASNMKKVGQLSGQRSGLTIGILPCK